MKDSIYFTVEERAFFERIIDDGLMQDGRRGVYWWIVRIAIARSLQESDEPDERYKAMPKSPSELHLEQITGRAKQPDYDDAFALLLSLRRDEDLFENHDLYVEVLQRHARRGMELLHESWLPGTSFHDVILDSLYFRPSVDDDHSPNKGDVQFDILKKGLQQIGVDANPIGEPISGPRLSRHRLTLGGVEDYDRLRRGLEDLAFAIGLGTGTIAFGREPGERRVVLDIPRPSGAWRDVPWPPLVEAFMSSDAALAVCPGVDVIGEPVVFDFVEAPHMFVAGATGSGKSVCMNAILLSMLASDNPPELLMIDPKGVDFAEYDGLKLLRGEKVVTEMGAAVEMLRAVVEEMDARQERLREFGARNIAEARAAGSPMRRLVVVVDELADFLMSRTGAEEPLVRIAQKARAVGIHLLLATQRPEAATFPGLLRANIPSRIALTVQKSSDSRIILDESGAEDLMMRGDMLIKLAGRPLLRAHGARVDVADVKRAVAAANSRHT
ncbi:FtsK/SpoIIIE domain-containing protein [Mesorhizobium sp. M0579]|uniref:FtsK/SpoIIIE domain-containing protein n=1 Tax=Mesorhizobium sp. M0579 TaxID=2956962 RepID=UPI00333D2457